MQIHTQRSSGPGPSGPAPASAPASPTVPAAVRALAGCYQLELLGPWRRRTVPYAERYYLLPRHLQLHPIPINPAGVWYAAEPAIRIRRPKRTYAYDVGWGIAGNTVRVQWGNGFDGVKLELLALGDTLAGRAHTYTDVIDPRHPPGEAEVRLLRERCGHPPSATHDE